jgi:hypothetical protein
MTNKIGVEQKEKLLYGHSIQGIVTDIYAIFEWGILKERDYLADMNQYGRY